jgi:16S rRNA (adenine1518-N6/adenine1519-N6)-dimethyltransferase
MAIKTNKNLGQHWLSDNASLEAICDAAEVGPEDVVLEIGPGLGTLTAKLARRAKLVVAVEFDRQLAETLPQRVQAKNLQVVHHDILTFNLSELPKNYKVVANVPYYITSRIVQLLLESENPPISTTLLVQKEVAERISAEPGDMSVLAVSAQLYAEPELDLVIPAHLFQPPPEVDSQIITLRRRSHPLFPDIDLKDLFKLVKAGFSERRKKLRSSLSGGLGISKEKAEELLRRANVSPDARAQELSLEDWAKLTRTYTDL